MGMRQNWLPLKLDGKYQIYTYKNMKIPINRSNSQRPR